MTTQLAFPLDVPCLCALVVSERTAAGLRWLFAHDREPEQTAAAYVVALVETAVRSRVDERGMKKWLDESDFR